MANWTTDGEVTFKAGENYDTTGGTAANIGYAVAGAEWFPDALWRRRGFCPEGG